MLLKRSIKLCDSSKAFSLKLCVAIVTRASSWLGGGVRTVGARGGVRITRRITHARRRIAVTIARISPAVRGGTTATGSSIPGILLQQDIVGSPKVGDIFLQLGDLSTQRHVFFHKVPILVIHGIPGSFSRGFVVISPAAAAATTAAAAATPAEHRLLRHMAKFAPRAAVALVVEEILTDGNVRIATTPSTTGVARKLTCAQVFLLLLVGHVQVLARGTVACTVLEIAAYHRLILRLASHSGGVRELTLIPSAANAALEISTDRLVFGLIGCVQVFAFHRYFIRELLLALVYGSRASIACPFRVVICLKCAPCVSALYLWLIQQRCALSEWRKGLLRRSQRRSFAALSKPGCSYKGAKINMLARLAFTAAF